VTAALFERDGSHVVPTDYARGPWRRDSLHGGAVAALLASAIDVPGCTPVRITFDLLAPVRTTPLTIQVTRPEGGRRVARQSIMLFAGDTPVASAQCVAVRRAELDLPESVADQRSPFADIPEPDLNRSRPEAAEAIGWECFDSRAVAVRMLRSPELGEHRVGLWISLLVPVVAGEPTPELARVAAAADYGSAATSMLLPFDRWSFMNAELSLHLSREPIGPWVGLVSTGVVQPNGCGLGAGALYDRSGPLGQSAQALVVEERERISQR
jgi:hypothetical protein